MEIDYKSMFEVMSKRLEAALRSDKEYFSLLATVSDKAKYTEAACSVMLKFPKTDQIQVLKAMAQLGLVAEELCRKHNIDPGEEEE